jgi:predicted HD phosphohydrolase
VTAAPFTSVDELIAVLRDERGGDVVTALTHGLQCAWRLAQQSPEDVELQIAGLVHDVASSVVPRPVGDHAAIGAEMVRPLVGHRVADLVGGHVVAKRYLVTVDNGYRSILSVASTRNLVTQGDTLSDGERLRFESSPLADDWLQLRRADEHAKVPGREVPALEHWRPMLEELASAM